MLRNPSDNILLAMSSFNEFCTWEINYADGQGCMLLVVKLPPFLAFVHGVEITCAKPLPFEPWHLSIQYQLPINYS
jgi:hypothetical protein